MIIRTSHFALLDLISLMTFVFIPVAWLPLIILFGVFALWEKIQRRGLKFEDSKVKLTAFDYDGEYFPE